jgi:DNA-binding CsgD family transcriptional regulator
VPIHTEERDYQARAMSELLESTADGPAGLIIEGQAGIGKTTIWLSAVEEALAQGFRVLSARPGQTESVLGYAALADLIGGIEDAVLDGLPPLQRVALDRVLLRSTVGGPVTDQRVAAAAVGAIIETLAATTPVLVAVDDVQWLDSSSRAVIGFVLRRLAGRVAVMVTDRHEPGAAPATAWLQLARPERLHRIAVAPLDLAGMHSVIGARLGRRFTTPTLARIHQVSGGNPFYALELARAIEGPALRSDAVLPATLAEVVHVRIQHLHAEARAVLLGAACVADPTVELLTQATDLEMERVVELLDEMGGDGIITIEGNQVRFTHPLLARGVYTGATRSARRFIHRRLADLVDHPELTARHLALAAATSDPDTLQALDTAAEVAHARGAPAAAAELIELAISLGGDTTPRRIRAAEFHFRAGSLLPARLHLQSTIDSLPAGTLRCSALMLLGAVKGYDDDTAGAVEAMIQALHEAEDNTALRLHCLLRLVAGLVMVGRVGESVDHARSAVALADRLDVPGLRSQALAIWVTVSFVHGLGVDRRALQTALELEDPHGDATTWYQASAVQAMISAWTGDLGQARDQMRAVQHRMLNGGTEIDIIWAANHLATIDVWSGRYVDAADTSRQAVQRAEQMGGRHLLVTAWSWQAEVAAYTGREADARSAAGNAIAAGREIGGPYLITAPTASLAFLEVSLGNYGAALTVLEPLLATFDAAHDTEIVVGGHLPDAIEALVALGRLDDAEPLVAALQNNGARVDRPWMCALGARGRAHLCAARQDLDGADHALQEALSHHERLPMPFERARTQLLLGQLQRRQRRKEAAAATLREALHAFEYLGTPVWADRARAELARTNVAPDTDVDLTPSERRVADLAASGMKNRDVAAALFISTKTVEANLSRIYHKLGIRSRAELGRWHSQLPAVPTQSDLAARASET